MNAGEMMVQRRIIDRYWQEDHALERAYERLLGDYLVLIAIQAEAVRFQAMEERRSHGLAHCETCECFIRRKARA